MCGIAAAISPIEKTRPYYKTTMITHAITMPPKPAASTPKFQPEKLPDMTAPTARPQRPQIPAARLSLRYSKYPDSAWV